jgi:hypothetical protein
VACIGERSACRVLVGKPKGKRPLRTSRPRAKCNKWNLKKYFCATCTNVSVYMGKWWNFCEGGTESQGCMECGEF